MSRPSTTPRRRHAAAPTIAERRDPRSALQRLGGLLGLAPRPVAERVATDGVPSPRQLCVELRARLLGLEHAKAVEVMKHLILVHDTLASRGWRGVAGLPERVLARAVLQAEILSSEEKSPTLAYFIDKLRRAHTAAQQRDDDDPSAVHEIRIGENLEVTESSHAEFDDMARSWAGTVPSQLDPPLAGDVAGR